MISAPLKQLPLGDPFGLFAKIFQGCFTGTHAIVRMPNASEVALDDRVNRLLLVPYHNKTQFSLESGHTC